MPDLRRPIMSYVDIVGGVWIRALWCNRLLPRCAINSLIDESCILMDILVFVRMRWIDIEDSLVG